MLYRDLLSADLAAAPAATRAAARKDRADVFEYYPGARGSGGRTRTVSLNRPGWLPKGSVVLFGNNVHTYSDVNDNNVADAAEEISPVGRTGYRFPVVRTKVAGEPCTAWVCTWDPGKGLSWQKNDERTATQNFYFINRWHDYLARAPIGFTEAAGNFQQVNASGSGKGGDPVHDESLDGADTQAGVPDLSHIDNANFATPPDGQPPTMQMYLWHAPGASSEQDPFIPTMGSDEADIVYHEYTHGLSHRLVTDAGNNPALDSVQGGSMGEAWSDWYALDYLVNQGHIKDTRQGRRHQPRPVRRCGARHPERGHGLPGRLHGRGAAPAPRAPRGAATRTATSAASSTRRVTCTPPARSGRRPCGTCAPPSARG